MQKQTSQNQANILKNIDFTAWQFRHALKQHQEIEASRIIRARQHLERPVHVN